jgi:hypothetical protein
MECILPMYIYIHISVDILHHHHELVLNPRTIIGGVYYIYF